MSKGQGALEYLLIIGGAILISVIVISILVWANSKPVLDLKPQNEVASEIAESDNNFFTVPHFNSSAYIATVQKEEYENYIEWISRVGYTSTCEFDTRLETYFCLFGARVDSKEWMGNSQEIEK